MHRQNTSMNKAILAFILLASISGCKKTSENNLKEEIGEVPKVEISVARFEDMSNVTEPQGDAIYNLLGYGYDITNKYASTSSVRAQVIDLPLFIANNDKEAFSPSNGTQNFSMSFYGANAEDLSAQLSERYDVSNGLNVFKSTFVSSFPESNALSKKYGYGYFSWIFIRRKLRIQATKGSNSLTTIFTEDVKTLNAEQLVKKYGTHILQRIHIGTRINILYQSEVPDNSERILAIKEGMNYAINKVFGFFQSNGGLINVKALNTNSSIKLRYDMIGGDISKVKELEIVGVKRIDFNEWNKSLSESDYRFIDFDSNGLIPLYDLIADNTKKRVVKEFIVKYILENQTKTSLH
jgi:hypothetical protein